MGCGASRERDLLQLELVQAQRQEQVISSPGCRRPLDRWPPDRLTARPPDRLTA